MASRSYLKMKLIIKKYKLSLIFIILMFMGSYVYFYIFNNDVLSEEEVRELFLGNTPMDDLKLIKFLRYNMTKPVLRSNSTPNLLSWPANFHWSERQESAKADEMLKGREKGFFVECGAADGERISNSLFFETKRSYTGLLVEANPTFYKDLVKKKRNTYSFQGCLSTTTHPQMLTFAVQSFQGGIVDSFKSKERVKYQKIENATKIQAMCVPLYSMLLALGRTKIDFFSLDTEGSELDILKTIPFDKITIEVLVVEYHVDHGTQEQEANNIENLNKFFANVGGYSKGEVIFPNVFFRRIA